MRSGIARELVANANKVKSRLALLRRGDGARATERRSMPGTEAQQWRNADRQAPADRRESPISARPAAVCETGKTTPRRRDSVEAAGPAEAR